MQTQFWTAMLSVGIPLVGVIVLQVVNLILNHKRDQAAIEREHQREIARLERAKEAKAIITQIADKVEVVHKATNSLTDRLVEETDRAAFARGEKSEVDKQEAKD